jgi:hypothetical protein
MSLRPTLRSTRSLATRDAGGVGSGILIAVVILAALVVGGFFYFGGEADVDIKNPDVHVSSSETPSN